MTRALTYDPFGWRHTELADPTIHPLRRDELVADLVACEAEELARGRSHVTVVHGDPTDLAGSDRLDRFYDTIRSLVGTAQWSRLSGGSDYLTVTVAGVDRDWLIADVIDEARRGGAVGWIVSESPNPMFV